MIRNLVLLVALSSPVAAAEITTLAGLKYTGTLEGVAGGNVTIRTETGPLTIAVKDMAGVDFGAKTPALDKTKHDELELTDGSLLRSSSLKIIGKKVEPLALAGPAEGKPPTLSVPLESVFYWLRGADEAKNHDDWKKLLASRGKRDLFVIRQPDGLSPVPGTILGSDDTGLAINFEREDGQKVNFKLARATGGLVFNQPPRGVIPPTLCKLTDVFGNVLIVQNLEVKPDAVVAKTVSEAVVSYSSLAAIAKLDFSSGNVMYLSDLEPAVAAPMGEPLWTYLKDKTPDGPGFKLAGLPYARGLWIAPDVSLTYKLNAGYREFKALVGVDDAINIANSAVRLTIEADGKPVFSEVISRKDKPKELVLDVKNVKLLKLSVEGEGLFLGNQVDLVDARLQK